MTGFNNRIVNPGLQPLKGYWTVIDDSRVAARIWNRVSWNGNFPTGCTNEVYVRADDDPAVLASDPFVTVTNGSALSGVKGRYIEVRVAMTRDSATKQPVLYDLTLFGISSGFAGDYFLFGASAEEGHDGVFATDLEGAEPVGYRWFRQYPWETNMVEVAGATNWYLTITNVDSWVEGTVAMLSVTNAIGETVLLGPAELLVYAVRLDVPPTNYPSRLGPASRYPAVISVFGQPTNFNRVSVSVTLWGLTHQRSADLSILLVSPAGRNVMLMSDVGGTNAVSSASMSFTEAWSPPAQFGRIPSGGPFPYGPSNYGGETQMPQVGTDPPPSHTGLYSANLDGLQYDDPNGRWRLYIYDRYQGMGGELDGSWQIGLEFQ